MSAWTMSGTACAKCNKLFTGVARPIKCAKCDKFYHTGCANQDFVTERSDTAEDIRICPKCAGSEVKGAMGDTAKILESIAELKSSMSTMERSFNRSFEKLDKTLEDFNTRIKEIEKRQNDQEEVIKVIPTLQTATSDLAEYNRRNTIEIQGIPEKHKETSLDLFKIMKDLGSVVEVNIEPNHIDAIHRVPTRAGLKPIIVKFSNRWVRDELMIKKRSKTILLEDIGMTPSQSIVYINESLTPAKREIAKNARIRFKGKGCSVWTAGGKIFVAKKVDRNDRQAIRNNPKHEICGMDDIDQIFTDLQLE